MVNFEDLELYVLRYYMGNVGTNYLKSQVECTY